ncbi:ATP-dependent DNA ligase [Virgisporangium ochraceum]|uniref:Probable DNA ligase n=1 Tax=Virgisporangium ochraceum TaxID=65505 RepID=A0A8J3ZNY3_9ACTN|nr:ATP-dependent DNA ligase [Virgisporangium ochraceum]GIJ67699.1 DNA ligase B [Virgisporangium ochraceum]
MLFADLAATSAAVAATSGRLAKIDLLADCLRRLAADTDDPRVLAAGAAYLAGELLQRQTGVGYASLRDLPPPASEPSLTVADVDRRVGAMSVVAGRGSQAERRRLLEELFVTGTVDEQRMLVGLLSGELRQGAQAGLLADAIAKAASVPATAVRRALLLSGSLTEVAAVALTGGSLDDFRLTVGRPLAPMLASSAPDVAAALTSVGMPAIADVKLDGIRVQAHRDGDTVKVFSRSLDDITARVPGVVSVVGSLPVRSVVLDGEALGVGPDGRPLPFQETSSRAARRDGALPVQPFFFDVLHLDGADLLDAPLTERWAALSALAPPSALVGHYVVDSPDAADAAWRDALAAGHEGLVVKSASAPYDVGRRGAAWVKVKPRHTLDLVILGVEWGSGRRRGWLSNLHLGARSGDGFVMLGKTFKGLTDEMLKWQTEKLLSLATDKGEWVVKVRPELVAEIAFDGVQRSSRYPGGVALRFARVVRYREDKTAAEADTIEQVRALATWLT